MSIIRLLWIKVFIAIVYYTRCGVHQTSNCTQHNYNIGALRDVSKKGVENNENK